MLGIGLLTLGYQARLQSIKNASGIAARCAADAGLTKAIDDMNQKLKISPWDDSTLPVASNASLPGSNSSYSFTIVKSGSDYIITAVGNSGQVQKQVSCKLVGQQSLFNCALFGDESIILYNSSTIDQYNAAAGALPLAVGTNSTANGAVTLKNSARIDGNVIVGPGGNPNSVISMGNSSVITGTKTAASAKTQLSSVSVPSAISSLPSSGTLSLGNSGATTVSTPKKYTSISLGNSSTVTINGNVTLYVTGNVTLGNSSQIKVTPGSSLTIYLGGKLSSNNSSNINNETQNPHKAIILGLDTCTTMAFKNSSAFYGVVYAPKAAITYHNSAAIYGALVSKKFETKNSAAIHYDASLKTFSLSANPTAFTVKNWSEN
jgi:hypothetical protein